MSPFLKIGITLAIFKESGTTPFYLFIYYVYRTKISVVKASSSYTKYRAQNIVR